MADIISSDDKVFIFKTNSIFGRAAGEVRLIANVTQTCFFFRGKYIRYCNFLKHRIIQLNVRLRIITFLLLLL